ncbi:MAG: N-acetylmuramoyl-L-alanine amidase [Holosporales bacterium]|nr:N-acetylmuramoyl-L-alanine amidase [Holosporales bacterium]
MRTRWLKRIGILIFAAFEASAAVPHIQCFEAPEGVCCLVTLDKPLTSPLKVRHQKNALSVAISQDTSAEPALSLFRPIKVGETLAGYELHRTPEVLRLRFNGLKPLRVQEVTVVPKGEKFLLKFFLVPDFSRKVSPPSGKKLLIALDPGHGGIDPGSSGAHGSLEKEITLRVAHFLEEALVRKGYRVFLTRRKDETLCRVDRLKRVGKMRADLFLSLHVDHNPDPRLHGLSIYTLSATASDTESAHLAQRENEAERQGEGRPQESPEVAYILDDLIARDTRRKAEKFAQCFTRAVHPADRLSPKMHRSAKFLILQSPAVPSVLIELGCLSNAKEGERLSSEVFLHKIVHYILCALRWYEAEIRT